MSIESPQAITFRHELVDGVMKVYVVEDWPRQILIIEGLLVVAGHTGGILTVTDDRLTIAVRNGKAVYSLNSQPVDMRGTRLGTLVEGSHTFECPPTSVMQ